MNDRSRELRKTAGALPRKPGIYFFKNARGEVIYIGKARSLAHRVKSYFLTGGDAKVRSIVSDTQGIDYILTESEREAAFLENNFIQQFQPKFNQRLKDDKSFPYLKISVQTDFPRVSLVRKVTDDGSKYYGPFSPALQARRTILLLNRYFGIRSCSEKIPGSRQRPCLEHDMSNCAAPCTGRISQEEYFSRVENALLFLDGRVESLKKRIQSKMKQAADRESFEEAAHWRDFLMTLEQIKDKPRVISVKAEDVDVVGLSRENDRAALFVLLMRSGKVIQSTGRIRLVDPALSDHSILRLLTEEFYRSREDLPEKILLPLRLSKPEQLERMTVRKGRKKTILSFPVRGKSRRLVDMSSRNAAQLLEKSPLPSAPLLLLQKLLELKHLPVMIEGYDISNTGGTETVGARVAFRNGTPDKDLYRKYKIRWVDGPNDTASLQEVLSRRFTRMKVEKQRPPDLILVDGGKGQFNTAKRILADLKLADIPVISLAKKEEIIFSDSHPKGLNLSSDSPALRLLQYIRNESHRFAVGYHRRRRERASFTSLLTEIPGIGPQRRRALLTHFRTLEDIKNAPLEKLRALIGKSASESLLRYLND